MSAKLWPPRQDGIPELPRPPHWTELARCAEVDPSLWFPEKGGPTREAKAICRGCEVRETCLEYALETGQRWGIWGGLSEHERRRIRRQRELGAAA
jgi:WhiB family redox-sensing transcriptional regulator